MIILFFTRSFSIGQNDGLCFFSEKDFHCIVSVTEDPGKSMIQSNDCNSINVQVIKAHLKMVQFPCYLLCENGCTSAEYVPGTSIPKSSHHYTKLQFKEVMRVIEI